MNGFPISFEMTRQGRAPDTFETSHQTREDNISACRTGSQPDWRCSGELYWWRTNKRWKSRAAAETWAGSSSQRKVGGICVHSPFQRFSINQYIKEDSEIASNYPVAPLILHYSHTRWHGKVFVCFFFHIIQSMKDDKCLSGFCGLSQKKNKTKLTHQGGTKSWHF